MAEPQEQRKFKRCAVRIPLKIKDDSSESDAYTFNLSVSGLGALSQKPFPLYSKVYITLSLPKEGEGDVDQAKIIGNIIRVDEVSADDDSTSSLGIHFQNISENDVVLLKSFLQKASAKSKAAKGADEVSDEKEPEDLEVEGIEVDIAPAHESEMKFLDNMEPEEDKLVFFIKFAKYFFKLGLLGLFLYVAYYIILFVMKLTKLQ